MCCLTTTVGAGVNVGGCTKQLLPRRSLVLRNFYMEVFRVNTALYKAVTFNLMCMSCTETFLTHPSTSALVWFGKKERGLV